MRGDRLSEVGISVGMPILCCEVWGFLESPPIAAVLYIAPNRGPITELRGARSGASYKMGAAARLSKKNESDV